MTLTAEEQKELELLKSMESSDTVVDTPAEVSANTATVEASADNDIIQNSVVQGLTAEEEEELRTLKELEMRESAGGFGTGLAQGLTLKSSDEIMAGFKTAAEMGDQFITSGEVPSWKDASAAYDKFHDEEQAAVDLARDVNPGSFIIGDLAGTAMATAAGGLAGTALRAALSGGAMGVMGTCRS